MLDDDSPDAGLEQNCYPRCERHAWNRGVRVWRCARAIELTQVPTRRDGCANHSTAAEVATLGATVAPMSSSSASEVTVR